MNKADQQIIDGVAVEIMGAKKGYDGGRFIVHITNKNQVGWSDMDAFDTFNPLLDANHTRMARKKMRELGYWRTSQDLSGPDKRKTNIIWQNKKLIVVSEVSDPDELRAECISMLAARAKE